MPGLPAAGEIRRRTPRPVPFPGTRRERSRPSLPPWLRPRGLVFNEDKTRVVPLNEGFDFLGFTVRRYHGKLLIKPSQEAVRPIRERLRSRGAVPARGECPAMLIRLNPIVRGWAAYYRTVVASQAFAALDLLPVAAHLQVGDPQPPDKPRPWVVARYFGQFNKSRQDRWVFGDRAGGAYLQKFAWTHDLRDRMFQAGASPDDPALTAYWATRRRKSAPADQPPTLRLLRGPRASLRRPAEARCCTPMTRRPAPPSGSGGCGAPARRPPPRGSPIAGVDTSHGGAAPSHSTRLLRYLHVCEPSGLA